MKISATIILLMALIFQVSTARSYRPRTEKYDLEEQGGMPYSLPGTKGRVQERARTQFNFGTFKAVTIFAKNNKLDVYEGNRPGGGKTPIASITLGSQRTKNSDGTLLFDPQYTHDGVVQGSVYLFQVGRLLNVGHGESCTLFDAETDYPLATPRRSVGLDSLGNHVGRELNPWRSGGTTYPAAFWILFDEENYIIPESDEYDYEAHIVCTEI